MQRILLGTVLLVLACSSANAALVSRAGGLAYYDTDTNLTWIADANLAVTNNFGVAGIGVDGTMSFATANAWIGGMNTANYLGTNDWRLPTTLYPDPSCSVQTPNISGGSGCTGSEMGHLFNLEGITSSAPGPFSNLGGTAYYSGTAIPMGTSYFFEMTSGFQAGIANVDLRAWAVRSGDIAAVPVPPAVWLFGSALGLMGVVRRKISS